MKERQRQQQRVGREVPTDLRATLEAIKRARDQVISNPFERAPNPSLTQQPEARRVRLAKEMLSPSETQQLDIATIDAVHSERATTGVHYLHPVKKPVVFPGCAMTCKEITSSTPVHCPHTLKWESSEQVDMKKVYSGGETS